MQKAYFSPTNIPSEPFTFVMKKYATRFAFLESAIQGRKLAFLDVGNLGDGEVSFRPIQQLIESLGGTYTGLDSNEPLTKKLNLPNQVVGDLRQTPFPDASFDAIYAGEILEHTWEPDSMISECRRILKPGGILILDTPNAYAALSIMRFLFGNRDWMGDDRFLTYHESKHAFGELEDAGHVLLQPQHKIFYTPAMLKQLFEMHGFVIESMGTTQKPMSFIHRIVLWMFPQTGRHLCYIARKATVEESFADIVHAMKQPSA